MAEPDLESEQIRLKCIHRGWMTTGATLCSSRRAEGAHRVESRVLDSGVKYWDDAGV
ncbi:CDK10 isoform 16 [Pongo abelii]|uniref:CDK10 isoform 16 n=1 Tax=Pongo abelii TaxID=9601 RepID=A0A2J8RV58_PONAB|nr:CDK10 isoform 16 [Pongo abelii]